MEKFTSNSKTILSVDFDRDSTCQVKCGYCYVGNMERIYPAYKKKVEENTKIARRLPLEFADGLNKEYLKAKLSVAKQFKRLKKRDMSIRIYGGGDFVPEHLEFLEYLQFPFFIISKNLVRSSVDFTDKLVKFPNLTRLVLSLDSSMVDKFYDVSANRKLSSPKLQVSFTGTEADFNRLKVKDGLEFDIFFNIGKRKIDKEASSLHKEACPCDSGQLPHSESCSYCSKCWGGID